MIRLRRFELARANPVPSVVDVGPGEQRSLRDSRGFRGRGIPGTQNSTTLQSIQKSDLKERGRCCPAFSCEEEGTARAAEMTDKFHKMAMRNLRALRDLRRYAPAVSIQNAGQVNIGEKQVNLTSA